MVSCIFPNPYAYKKAIGRQKNNKKNWPQNGLTPPLQAHCAQWAYIGGQGGVQPWGSEMARCGIIPFPKTFLSQSRILRVECCEKYKSFKLKIPQPDSERRHSPDFRTVFGIMIGPFSSCEIGKTWGTNKQVNKQTNKNWKFQFPQPDYRPRHSPDFRTVFGIMIGPFSSCEIGKTWGT